MNVALAFFSGWRPIGGEALLGCIACKGHNSGTSTISRRDTLADSIPRANWASRGWGRPAGTEAVRRPASLPPPIITPAGALPAIVCLLCLSRRSMPRQPRHSLFRTCVSHALLVAHKRHVSFAVAPNDAILAVCMPQDDVCLSRHWFHLAHQVASILQGRGGGGTHGGGRSGGLTPHRLPSYCTGLSPCG